MWPVDRGCILLLCTWSHPWYILGSVFAHLICILCRRDKLDYCLLYWPFHIFSVLTARGKRNGLHKSLFHWEVDDHQPAPGLTTQLMSECVVSQGGVSFATQRVGNVKHVAIFCASWDWILRYNKNYNPNNNFIIYPTLRSSVFASPFAKSQSCGNQ
jgi:hypothetical protein